MRLKIRVGPIRQLEAGEPIGYNRRWTDRRKTRVATLPIGYADGVSRRLRGRCKVIIQDRWAEIIGAISMDMMSVDRTDLRDVGKGEEVILLGSSAHCCITAEEWASALGTIPYEIIFGIAARVPRIYL